MKPSACRSPTRSCCRDATHRPTPSSTSSSVAQLHPLRDREANLPRAGDHVAWTGVPHMNRPTNRYHSLNAWLTDFRTRGGVAAVADELPARGLDKSKLGLVGFSSPIQITPSILHQDVLNLQKLLPEAQFVDASWILEEMRVVKSEEEIEMLRKAGRIARKVVDAMVETARPGIPEAVVYAEMIKTQIANGGEPNIFNP